MLIVVVLLLLLGGGGGAYYVLQKDALAEPAQPEMVQRTEEPVYVEFNPILLPIVGDGRVEQFVNIVVALEVPDQAAADRAIAMAPRLNDAYLRSLYGTLHSRDVLHNGIVDLPLIKRRLVEESNRVLGIGTVQDALIQMVSQRLL
ncbi:MAG: hypothetical protein GVY13_18120 [Alphaproteobacteria bacterium]|nr:hypothetical protein [Alphaproteobacteria bacterium]